jgi:5-methylcytosine-specific restriction endonuclease McrA
MPWERWRYPSDWRAISDRIRTRAQGRCEGPFGPDWSPPKGDADGRCGARQHEPHPITGSRVILTVAHVHDRNPINCSDWNLGAACQRCHLNWDRPHHIAKMKARRHARRAVGDLFQATP